MKIITRDVPPRAAWTLEQSGVHPLLAKLYAARGVLVIISSHADVWLNRSPENHDGSRAL